MKIYHFTPLHTSEMSDPEDFALVLSPETHESIVANYQLDVTPSTDDKPFFFQTLRFSDIFRTDRQAQWVTSFNMRAVVVLLMCLGMVILLAVGGLLLPLKLASRHHAPLPRFRLLPHSLYFAAIGLGFILVELAAIQRLTIFLGHPVYSLAVVLFGILLATGAGSYLTQRVFIDNEKVRKSALAALGVLFVVQIVLSLTTPSLLGILHGASVPIRLALALGVVGLMGLTLGMGFPIGIGLAAGRVPEQTPWLWAVNGAMSCGRFGAGGGGVSGLRHHVYGGCRCIMLPRCRRLCLRIVAANDRDFLKRHNEKNAWVRKIFLFFDALSQNIRQHKPTCDLSLQLLNFPVFLNRYSHLL